MEAQIRDGETNQELRPWRYDDAPADRLMPSARARRIGASGGLAERGLSQKLDVLTMPGPGDGDAWRTGEGLERTESEQTGPGIGVSRRSHGPEARGGQQSFVSPSQAVMSRVAGGCHVHGLTKKVGGARRNVSLHIPTEPAAETGLAPSVAL